MLRSFLPVFFGCFFFVQFRCFIHNSFGIIVAAFFLWPVWCRYIYVTAANKAKNGEKKVEWKSLHIKFVRVYSDMYIFRCSRKLGSDQLLRREQTKGKDYKIKVLIIVSLTWNFSVRMQITKKAYTPHSAALLFAFRQMLATYARANIIWNIRCICPGFFSSLFELEIHCFRGFFARFVKQNENQNVRSFVQPNCFVFEYFFIHFFQLFSVSFRWI